jgi:lysophospholipase L1-like esterase
MSRSSNLIRGAAGLAALAFMAACSDADSKLLVPKTDAASGIFASYVAMGNSITAGYQSGGINDSTQRQSFAFLLAQQAGTRFAYPSFNKQIPVVLTGTTPTLITSGCGPMLGNWATQKTTDSLIAASPSRPLCSLRDATKATDFLNNVAVPGAFATDLLEATNIKTPAVSGAANQFILGGGVSQLDRALMAEPTFFSLWIGNNETLQPASVGMLGGNATFGVPALVSATEFSDAFNKVVDSIVKVRPGIKGVLIGAVDVTNVPRFFSADSLAVSTSRQTAWSTFTGKGLPLIVGCGPVQGQTGWLISIELPKNIRTGAFPSNAVVCNPAAPTGTAGDIFMLSPAEQATISSTVAAYNVTVKAKADQYGFAYVDPNPILAAQRVGATATIPAFPNLTSNTRDAANSVFGALFSLDGAHPSGAGQRVIANVVIDSVNSKYGLTIPKVP